MHRPIFLSLTQLSRALNRDHRSATVRSISPAAFVQNGTKLIPVYSLESGGAQGSTKAKTKE
jgi:hypothetical protein